MAQALIAVLAVLGSLGGVILGSYLSGRAQTRAWQREALDRDKRDKRVVMSAFATAAREWRATVMSETQLCCRLRQFRAPDMRSAAKRKRRPSVACKRSGWSARL
ncbi:hypothetical protein GCM10020369_53320 [Cryptosporangium minutisporangium]|uniref:Uncharacterized protein n=1 Tax=Cryptosporangium minutisporangium TaxID=113569 RepID=A0ABP6T4X2_9ACTN